MKQTTLFFTLFLVLCITTPLLVLWYLKTENVHKEDGKLFILCTTSMITDTVQQIAGSCASVRGLMGPGIDPHLYKARESDAHALARADIIFSNGLHLEGKMASLLHALKGTTAVSLSDALNQDAIIFSEHTIADPHIWHDVSLWILVAQKISATLIAHDPDNAQQYRSNTQEYVQKLHELDAYVRSQIGTIEPEQRILVTAHDAFSYFGRAYGMHVVGLQGISTEAEISTHDIVQLVDFLISHKIKALFAETAIAKKALYAVQQAADARGWHVALDQELFADALGNPGRKGGTYIDMIRCNVDTIVDALKT